MIVDTAAVTARYTAPARRPPGGMSRSKRPVHEPLASKHG